MAELSAPYANFMINPVRGPGVCDVCLNLTEGYERCYACVHCEQWLDVVAPISYSIAHEQLHHALAAYKRTPGDAARRLQVELAAVLWRHLRIHEPCLARAAGVTQFDLVTTVPGGTPERDAAQPLREIAGELVAPLRGRYERLLHRTETAVSPRRFDPQRFSPARELDHEAVLLIDDTWTTGASAQSAAAVLKAAGAGHVGTVVIGRHLNRPWRSNDRRLRALRAAFDWSCCVHCDPERPRTADPPERPPQVRPLSPPGAPIPVRRP